MFIQYKAANYALKHNCEIVYSKGKMKPLDFIKTKKGNIGIIVEVSSSEGEKCHEAAIKFLHTFHGEKTAWWNASEFEVIDNLPDLLARNLKHPFGSGSYQPFE